MMSLVSQGFNNPQNLLLFFFFFQNSSLIVETRTDWTQTQFSSIDCTVPNKKVFPSDSIHVTCTATLEPGFTDLPVLERETS